MGNIDDTERQTACEGAQTPQTGGKCKEATYVHFRQQPTKALPGFDFRGDPVRHRWRDMFVSNIAPSARLCTCGQMERGPNFWRDDVRTY